MLRRGSLSTAGIDHYKVGWPTACMKLGHYFAKVIALANCALADPAGLDPPRVGGRCARSHLWLNWLQQTGNHNGRRFADAPQLVPRRLHRAARTRGGPVLRSEPHPAAGLQSRI